MPITLFGTNQERSPWSSYEPLLSNDNREENGDGSLDDSKQHTYPIYGSREGNPPQSDTIADTIANAFADGYVDNWVF